MLRFTPSDKIIRQTEVALGFLEHAAPLITYKYLVKVPHEEIDYFVKFSNKEFPPDLRYWLTTYGSGLIEIISTSIKIPSISDLLSFCEDGRLYGKETPADSWNRLPLIYSGTPSIRALDSTIVDKDGCTPVVETWDYSDKVSDVYASSWPMYLISNIISAANRSFGENETNAKGLAGLVEEIAAEYFPSIDRDLEAAHARAMKHNKTRHKNKVAGPHIDLDNTLILNGVVKTLGYPQESLNLDYSHFPSYVKSIKLKNFGDATLLIEENAKKGNSSPPSDAIKFIREKATKKDLKGLYYLIEHQQSEIRAAALEALGRIKLKKLSGLEAIFKRTSKDDIFHFIFDESYKKVKTQKQFEKWTKYIEQLAIRY